MDTGTRHQVPEILDQMLRDFVIVMLSHHQIVLMSEIHYLKLEILDQDLLVHQPKTLRDTATVMTSDHPIHLMSVDL